MVMFKIKCAVIGCSKRVNITDSFETTYDEVNIRIHCCSTCWNKFFSMTGSRIQYKDKPQICECSSRKSCEVCKDWF